MGLTLEGKLQPARLRGDVTDDMMGESNANSKPLVLARASQASMVQLDGLSVSGPRGCAFP